MISPVVKRSIVIAGHKTSVSLENEFWQGLKQIAAGRNVTLSELVATIDANRKHGNLSSAVRLFVLNHYQAQSSIQPHEVADDIAAGDEVGVPRRKKAAGFVHRRPRSGSGDPGSI
jgi:predicted DNA-binding ribbon-helix-helix protein